ncbi:hypothetical protein BKA64DRAFT_750817 [Cadophora sp. MPI-SDFR-AT-0126]|nr:hypothetical protein BKA64DRAFT_750817 [Leotiomycetes sp. MPI-SDFR-AT-0126]
MVQFNLSLLALLAAAQAAYAARTTMQFPISTTKVPIDFFYKGRDGSVGQITTNMYLSRNAAPTFENQALASVTWRGQTQVVSVTGYHNTAIPNDPHHAHDVGFDVRGAQFSRPEVHVTDEGVPRWTMTTLFELNYITVTFDNARQGATSVCDDCV